MRLGWTHKHETAEMVETIEQNTPAPEVVDTGLQGRFSLTYPLDLIGLAFERLWQHRALVFWTLIGLAAAAGLAISLLLFVDAVNSGLLASRLSNPPFAFRYRYLGVWSGSISQSAWETASEHMQEVFTTTIDLPTARLETYVGAGIWNMSSDGISLGGLTLGAWSGADDLIAITAGEWDVTAAPDADGTIPVLVSETLFETMGVQVGDLLTVTRAGSGSLQLRVVALWQPANASDPAWMLPPRFFESVILLPPDALWSALSGSERPVEEAVWNVIFDGQDVKTSDVSSLLGRIQASERGAAETLPAVRLEVSPVEGLRAFNREVEQLTAQLAIMSLPVGGLTLYFVALVAGLLVGRQANDDAILASRGMSRRAILLVHTLMWAILASAALLVAIVISPAVVQIVGKTSSFLRFENPTDPLPIVFTAQAVAAGACTAFLAAGCGMWFSWRSSRQGVVSQSPVRARRAWWQRAYLDVLLFIPAAYLLFTLWRSGGLTAGARDPFGDPLALGAPTLFALSLTLLFLRLYPFLLGIATRIVAYGRDVPLLMALRELTRSIGRYRGALMMMGFTLSLTGFTASMASTIDASLADTINYEIGADVVIVPATDVTTEEETNSSGEQTGVSITGFNTLPAEDLLAIDGVDAVSRVGRYPAQIILPNERPAGTAVGIDRATMAAVTRYRADYSAVPLADLFNLLATNRTGVILSADFAQRYHLAVGQMVRLQINALSTWSEISAPIIGVVDYFPTLDPRQGFFVLMSLDVIYETVGSELPHDFWLSVTDDADLDAIHREALALGYPILGWRDPATAQRAALAEPLRRGVLGFLSVGFIAAVALTLIGAVIQNAATFRAQATQLGVLRAMGLSSIGTAMVLLLTQGLAAGGGVLGGTLIGVATTLLYLPVLDFSGGLPPYLVRVAWNDIALVYAAFGGVLLIVILTTTIFMSRQSLTALVKLGD